MQRAGEAVPQLVQAGSCWLAQLHSSSWCAHVYVAGQTHSNRCVGLCLTAKLMRSEPAVGVFVPARLQRYCQYALLTLDFKARQDLFSSI